jgi:HPt (histidine-containing phosphotransfer) domain-containing protein
LFLALINKHIISDENVTGPRIVIAGHAVQGCKPDEEAVLMIIEDYINRKALNDRLEEDFDLFKELAQLFFSDSPRLLSAIEDAIRNKNGEKIGKTSHTMKGAVANFSAEKAFDAALALEKLGKSNDLGKVGDAFNSLSAEIENMRKALKLILDDNHL